MTDPALLAKISSLSPAEQERARAIIKRVSSGAGELLAVDVHKTAAGVYVTLLFEHGAWGFYHAGRTHRQDLYHD